MMLHAVYIRCVTFGMLKKINSNIMHYYKEAHAIITLILQLALNSRTNVSASTSTINQSLAHTRGAGLPASGS